MNFKLITAFLLLFVFTFALSATGKEQKMKKFPKAVINDPVFEFSSVVDGINITHDFIIHNRGTANLEIIKIKPG